MRQLIEFSTISKFKKQRKYGILNQKSVRTKSIYTNSLSKIYQIYSIPLAISMSKVPHGQKVQKFQKGPQKELSAKDVLFGY